MPSDHPDPATEQVAGDLLAEAIEADGEIVTAVDDSATWTVHYRAMQRRAPRVWFAFITEDTYPESDADPGVSFRWCVPDSDAAIMRKWTSAATGRLTGPQRKREWDALFAVYEAARDLYEADPGGHRGE